MSEIGRFFLDKIIADLTLENIFSSPTFCQMFALEYAYTTDSHKSIYS